ncbi:MAG: polyphosphate kinase 2, partial [Flavobacteriales bacterium]|nr:polyphosphate kinase 2 [Flavobacteriales bacterium]
MMNPEDLTDEDVELLNSKVGLKYLFAEKKVNLEKVLYQANYEAELRAMQAKLIKLQEW